MELFGFNIGRPKKPGLGRGPVPSLQDKVFEDIFSVEKPASSITDTSFTKVKDVVPDILFQVPEKKKPHAIPRVINPVLDYNSSRATGRGDFKSPEYDIAEIGRAEDTDSYVRQSFVKKTALLLKEGFDVVGPNPKTVKYIRLRLAQIARASDKTTRQLIREIGNGLIKKSNVFVVKVRKTEASGGKERIPPGKRKSLKPVAGYFVAPAETMEYIMKNGRVTKWRQLMPSGEQKTYSPDDVIHFHYDRKEGFVFGTPVIVPVLDDVRALRKIEENVELLVYQHLFPLFQWKVGTPEYPATTDDDGNREVDVVRREIQLMPSEGGIVTTERHEINAIGAQGRALDAKDYLEHFKKRVFSGLGISAVDMGEPDTSNKSTADNMSRNLIDSVKDFQEVLTAFFNKDIIDELLLESTFDDPLNEENEVKLQFREIDIDAQVKKENHHADLFAKNIETWGEARTAIGKDPILVPTRKEIDAEQDGPDKYPDWHNTNWKLFVEPERIIQSLDEPWTALSKAAAKNTSLDVNSSDVNKAQQESQQAERNKLALQAKQRAKNSSTRKLKDFFLKEKYLEVKSGISDYLLQEPNYDPDWIAHLVKSSMESSVQHLVLEQMASFQDAYKSVNPGASVSFVMGSQAARIQFRERSEKFVNKLVRDLTRTLKRKLSEQMSGEELSTVSSAIFDSLEFRTVFIEDVEVRKAFSLGEAMALKDKGKDLVGINSKENSCEECSFHSEKIIDLKNSSVEDFPPYHAGCNCSIKRSV